MKFILGFVESMAHVMDRRINEYVRAVDQINGRTRVFASVADKVTGLHRAGDAVALMIMTEVGELKVVFADYLLVTGHTEGLSWGRSTTKTSSRSLVSLRQILGGNEPGLHL